LSAASLTGRPLESYQPHLLHSSDRTYSETNCYADVVTELLHAAGYEPLAMFAHVVRMDFEGDQWSFFKPPAEDLERLFGVDIHEMNPYRPLPEQISEQIALGRAMIVELDSWYLPDRAATSYRSAHVKTSCAFDLIDRDAERLHYFHGPGLFALEGEDYRGVFRIGDFSADVLPPYVELVRFDAGPKLEGAALKQAARDSLVLNLTHRPAENPVRRFGSALERSLPALLAGDLEAYHAYAFATVRILGSGFEALGSFSRWLFGPEADAVVTAIDGVVASSKALSFRLARRREFDPEALLTSLAEDYRAALNGLDDLAS
jgi:hypothetical protein